MKKINKKGFTIVELVIVIAVIAILSAVLIPTFSSLIRKANISSDTVLCKNLNTALNIAEVENGVNSFDEALEAIKENGYLIANLNAKADGCFFVWESETNQILLVDSKNDYEVLFALKEGYGEPDESWHFAVSNKALADKVKADLNVTIKQTVSNINDFEELLNSGENQEIYIDESLVLTSENTIKAESGNNITIKLGESSLATNGVLNNTPIYVNSDTKLTIDGGSIGGAGNVSNENGTYTYVMSVNSNGRLILNDVKINTIVSGVTACAKVDGDAYVEINDGVINAGAYAVSMSCGNKGGKAVINNTNTNAAVPFFVSQGSKIIVNGGEHVSNGKTTQAGFSNCIFYVQDTGSTIEVTGGKFTRNGVTKTYEELCKEGVDAWKNLCVGDYNIEISADKKTVTITK